MKQLISALLFLALLSFSAFAQQCLVNMDQGCANQNIESGGSVTVKSGGAVDIQAGGVVNPGALIDVVLCGQLPNNTTNYMSPVTGFPEGNFYSGALTANDLSYTIGGTGCDAEDNATEATADEPLWANNAVKILGMVCKVSGSGSNGVTLNLRSAAGNLTPDITVTIPTTETTAATYTKTTTDIAAGATFALRAITTENLSAEDAWCIAKALVVP